MTKSRDPDRLIRAFLAEGQTDLPDQIYDAVRDRIEGTNQRVVIGPWRIADMNRFLAFGAAAAVVVLAVLIGLQVFSGGPSVSGPGPDATPSPSPSPSPTPQAWAGPIQVGRNEATIRGVRFSFSIPSTGWVKTRWEGMINRFPPGNWIGFLNINDSIANDPCAGTTTPVGPSVDDMADALTTIPGTEADAPIDATVGGRPAKLVTFTINDDIECDPSSFWIYGPDTAYPNSVASTIRTWVFELDGTRYSIHSNQESTDAEQAQEITEIVESIQFK